MAGIFCAIDTHDLARAVSLARLLSAEKIGLKLGLEFFSAHGLPGVMKVKAAAGYETPLFLDLKFHDIPNTVYGAVSSVLEAAPDFLTVHALGGGDMLKAALDAASRAPKAPMVLAVTVLTHMGAAELESVGLNGAAEDQVLRLANLAAGSGIRGLVSSAREVQALRKKFGSGMTLVVPGIRPDGFAQDDQKRTLTPLEAVRAGADYLVIGRPITAAKEPLRAALEIIRSIGISSEDMKNTALA